MRSRPQVYVGCPTPPCFRTSEAVHWTYVRGWPRLSAEHVRAALEGRRPQNLVNPEIWLGANAGRDR